MMMKLKKFFSIVVCIALCFCFAGCGETENNKNEGYISSPTVETVGRKNAVITVENYGEIKLELYGDLAPVTVDNFVKLAESGFYDGLTFHRIMKDFMIQGGDPEGTGMGGSDQNIYGEFAANKFQNNISHVRGVISMARLDNDYNSANSQFFIVHQDATHLDGGYAAFGKVTEGIEVVDKIAEIPSDPYTGFVEKPDQPVISSIEILD